MRLMYTYISNEREVYGFTVSPSLVTAADGVVVFCTAGVMQTLRTVLLTQDPLRSLATVVILFCTVYSIKRY